jgi:asparagine synthase (glutamine-hydrolysing)
MEARIFMRLTVLAKNPAGLGRLLPFRAKPLPTLPRPNSWCGVFGVANPADAMKHFGVEAAWHDERVAFGGGTVWADESGEWVLCGDVVLSNAPELRASLNLPYADTGSLLAELVAQYGADAGRHALGMFAVVAYSRRTGELMLLRDSVGARTLYYADDGKRGCWFASRLHLLRRTPAVSDQISLDALQHYLICAFVPGEQTLWQDVRELAPGTARLLPQCKTLVYWEPRESEWNPEESLESCAGRLRPLLEDSVQRVLPPSEAVGVFLSGGLDSSLVTALAARLASGDVHTFAVHFGAEHRNELEFSGMVAAHCGTHHHVLELPGKLIRDHLPETLALLDDPIGDPLTTPNLLLARTAAQYTGTTLNGEGGDPCFGGPKNLPMVLHSLYGQADSCQTAYLRSYQKCYDDLPRLLLPPIQAALAQHEPPENLFAPCFDSRRMSDYLNQLMLINVRFKGADHILTKVNNLSTAAGLIAHSPLFDSRIVDLSFALPPHYKLTGTTEKVVLKRAVADLLPESILTRPKSGMLVPVQHWFRNELKGFAHAHLLDRRARIRPYLNQDLIREWLDYRGCVFPRHGVKLWLLLTLELWLRANSH